MNREVRLDLCQSAQEGDIIDLLQLLRLAVEMYSLIEHKKEKGQMSQHPAFTAFRISLSGLF